MGSEKGYISVREFWNWQNIRALPVLKQQIRRIIKAAQSAMNSKVFCLLFVFCLLLSPSLVERSQALAVDKKKIMKALWLTKLALKKKKLLVVPLPVPIMVEKKHHEHHIEHHGYEKHHGW